MPYKILTLGASYGSLLATKLAMGGHHVTMVCQPHEVEAFNRDGAVIRMPVKGREGLVEINSKNLKGKVDACTTAEADPSGYDLIALGMQEPQYGLPGVRELMKKVAASGKPCMSIMNMPPLPFLKRIPSIDATAIRGCYADPTVWDDFDPKLMTLCSPDPQAFRPPEEPINVLQVRLPTNFKAARFENPAHTALLKQLEADVEAARFEVDGKAIELPVKLKVFDSVYVPLAKWSMLLAGNYRCVQETAMRPIKDAVHSDLPLTASTYEHVVNLCERLGANRADLVPFDKYANAAQSLGSPSSAARALAAGAKNIERVDKLVQILSAQLKMPNTEVEKIVAQVEGWLAKNRAAA